MTDPLLRERAQAQWKGVARKAQKLARDLTPEAASAMVHELQVHQIELEMQNEELQQSQLALEVTKARYFDLYELAPVGYLTVSEEGSILECNLAAASMLGVSRGGVTKKAFSQWIAKEDQDAWFLQRKKLAASHEQINVQLRIVRGDGSPLWCIVSAAKARDELGAMATRVTLTDVSERMLVGEKLRESEARRKVATDSGRVGIWEVNAKTNRMIWDDNCFALYHVRREDSNGTFEEWARTIHPQDLDAVVQAFQSAMTGISNYDLAFRIVWPDGSIRYMHGRGEAFRDGTGVSDRMIGTIWDITEQKLIEEELKLSHEQLEVRVNERTAQLGLALERLKQSQDDLIQSERLASLGAMVAGVSHELNTPIGNAVTTSSTLIETARTLDANCQTGVVKRSELNSTLGAIVSMSELIYRAVGRAATLIASFKQVAVDQTSQWRREFDLRDVVHDVITSLQPELSRLPWAIENTIPSAIVCDSFPGPLEQILTNLIRNAVIHAFPDRDRGTITLSASVKSEMLEIRVTDDGIGMDTATQVHVFDPFFTTKLGKGGSGLGLSISFRIASSVLAGNLKVSSMLGSGTTFILTIPIRTPGKL